MRVIRQGTESSFNSRSPSGLRPRVHQSMLRLHLFQFTQPKRAATTLTYGHAVFFLVSIHAAQAGCDPRPARSPSLPSSVSIHAAQAGCDGSLLLYRGLGKRFNSRSPSGLRPDIYDLEPPQQGFNSRSPSGLRQELTAKLQELTGFNSRSPSGLRHLSRAWGLSPLCFNSRSPSGLRRTLKARIRTFNSVSIHAAQAGCDLSRLM